MQYRVLSAGLRQVHICACGYRCDELEVMAVHAVRQHAFPFGTPMELETPTRVTVAKLVAATCMMEADDPSGPWTIAPDGVCTKRYCKVAWKP